MYINTHRQQRAQSSVPRRSHNTISTPIIVPFVQQLPPGHPFNNNAPQNQSGTSPNVPVNPSVPQTNDSLAIDVGAAPPQTPSSPPYTPMPLPSAKKEKTVRGKRLQYDAENGAPDDGAGSKSLPTIEEAIKNNMFDDIVIDELKQMAKDAGYMISLKGRKNKLISEIKKEHDRRTKTKT